MSNYQFGYQYEINPVDFLPPHHFPYESWPPQLTPFSDYYAQTHHLPPHYDVSYQNWPPKRPQISRPPSVSSANAGEECTIFFVISALLFSICGAFLGGASANSEWCPEKWKWRDTGTSVGMLSGAVGGILLPYGFFYSNATIHEKRTLLVASAGAYLGAAMVNRKWNPNHGKGWNWKSPSTYNGAFEGMQTALWLIDATSSITAFMDEVDLQGPPRRAFAAFTYGVGGIIAYHYVSQYHDGNYAFWEWDRVLEPGTVFAIVDGIESGTRLPVGFAEIGRDLANRTQNLLLGRDGTFKDIDPWSLFGASFMSFLYSSEENQLFDWRKWDWRMFSTLEAVLNGIVYGKDLPEMVQDVKRAFRQKSGSSAGSGWQSGGSFLDWDWTSKRPKRKWLMWLFDLLF